jgi:hypothetical protein
MSTLPTFALKPEAESPQAADAATLFFHYPCFDGLISAVIAWDYLETHQAWQVVFFSPRLFVFIRTLDIRSVWCARRQERESPPYATRRAIFVAFRWARSSKASAEAGICEWARYYFRRTKMI